MIKTIGAILISFVVIFAGWAIYTHQTNLSNQQERQQRAKYERSYHQQCDVDPSKYEHDKAWDEHQAACEQMKQQLEQ